MLGRHRRKFLSQLDRSKLEEAILAAERTTTADIRVAVLPHVRGVVAKVAELTAQRLGMTAVPDRNGVLILVVPSRREFHVWGDRAIHEKVGQDFWTSVAQKISVHFRNGDFTAGLLAGIDETGRELAAHFPARPGAPRSSAIETVVEEP
jgi:uncharacterized membrane protein